MEPTSVYQYYDAVGRLLYVGVTKRGLTRMYEHADSKPWWRFVTGSTVEHYASREEALVREAELIAAFNPPYNTQHNSRRREQLERYEKTAAVTRHRGSVTDELAKRRRAYYALSLEEKHRTPCIQCGQRPGHRGPTCLVCLQSKAFHGRSRSRTAGTPE